MITMDEARMLAGKTLMGAGGEKLGKIGTLYADRDGGEPTFATVTGGLGGKTHFVPLNEATMSGDSVSVPYGQDLVNSAPSIDEDAELEPAEEERLYSHYGVGGFASQAPQGVATQGAATQETRPTVGHDTSGPTTDDAMTRSEERLHVGTEQRETGRARLRKFSTSETETRTVPVSPEEVRIEREPITEANQGKAYDGPALSEEEHEVVLTAEVPVVAKETVPVERVRLDTETVTEQVTVTEEVRKEQIEMEGGDVYPAGDTRSTDRTNR